MVIDKEEIYQIVKDRYKQGTYEFSDLVGAVDEVEQAILNYCSRTSVPAALRFVVANMTIDLLKYRANDNLSLSEQEVDPSQLQSIKVGDTSYTFRKSDSNTRIAALILNYQSQLNHFRRIL